MNEVPAFQILHASGNLGAEEPEAGKWVLTLPPAKHIVQRAQLSQLGNLGGKKGKNQCNAVINIVAVSVNDGNAY